MKHYTSPDFWELLNSLPPGVQKLARENYELLKTDPRHPSLHFKRIGYFVSARVGISYRALGISAPDGILWFWIGSHAEYDRIIGS